MSIMNVVKEHPYMTAAGVFVAGALIIVILFGGSSDTAPTPIVQDDSAAIAANSQITMAQIAAQVQSGAVQADLQGRLAEAQVTKDMTLAGIASQSSANELQAEVARLQVAAQQHTEETISALSATVQNNMISSQVQRDQIAAASQISMTQALADVQKHADDIQFAMLNSNNAAQVAMATTFADAQVNINSQNNYNMLMTQQQYSQMMYNQAAIEENRAAVLAQTDLQKYTITASLQENMASYDTMQQYYWAQVLGSQLTGQNITLQQPLPPGYSAPGVLA